MLSPHLNWLGCRYSRVSQDIKWLLHRTCFLPSNKKSSSQTCSLASFKIKYHMLNTCSWDLLRSPCPVITVHSTEFYTSRHKQVICNTYHSVLNLKNTTTFLFASLITWFKFNSWRQTSSSAHCLKNLQVVSVLIHFFKPHLTRHYLFSIKNILAEIWRHLITSSLPLLSK